MPSTTKYPSNCSPTQSQAPYTCTAYLTVTWSTPGLSCTAPECHIEYCLTNSDATDGAGYLKHCFKPNNRWKHSDLTYKLPSTGPDCPSGYPAGSYCVWAEYRTDTSGGGYTYSPPSTSPAYVILNDTGPTASLNSPAGVIDPVNVCLANSQYVNYEAPQWITYSGSSLADPPLALTFAIDGCSSSSCSAISGASGLAGSSTMWDWLGTASSSDPGYSYLSLIATDQSGIFAPSQPVAACTGGPSAALSFYAGSTSPPYNSDSQPLDSVTELDWALRPDGTLMAVLTLAYVPDPNYYDDNTNPYQYGCAAVAFDIQNTTNPFGRVLATVTDIDNGTSANPQLVEEQGPSSCTYDPASNTGILIVRHLIDTSVGVQYQTYSIIDTGVLP